MTCPTCRLSWVSPHSRCLPSSTQPLHTQVSWRLGRYMAAMSEDIAEGDIVVVPTRSQQLVSKYHIFTLAVFCEAAA